MHGYAGHCSRPTQGYLQEYFTKRGISFLSFDFHGHGRSQGVRGLVQQPEDLFDDALAVLLHFYHKKLLTTPFFIMGHSMGGGVSILLSQLIHSNKSKFSTRFYEENK